MDVEQEKILKILFILIWVLVLIHLSAEHFYLYWILRWFDVLTHFIGGIWIGLATLWLWYFSGFFRELRLPDARALLIVFLAGLGLGLAWEAYELGIWHFSGRTLPTNYVPDTILDLIMDVVGAVTGYYVYHFLPRTTTHAEKES